MVRAKAKSQGQAESGQLYNTHVIQSSLQVASKRRYQIHLNSQSGPINVLLVNKESDHTPVAVRVAPHTPPTNVMSGALVDSPPPAKKFASTGLSPQVSLDTTIDWMLMLVGLM